MNGVIPIMRHFPGDDIYNDLPVLFVGERKTPETGQYEWGPELLSAQILEEAWERLSPLYDENGSFIEKKLTLGYWWELVQAKLDYNNKSSTTTTTTTTTTTCLSSDNCTEEFHF